MTKHSIFATFCLSLCLLLACPTPRARAVVNQLDEDLLKDLKALPTPRPATAEETAMRLGIMRQPPVKTYV